MKGPRGTFLALASLCMIHGVVAQVSGVHTEWPRWCGKVYESKYPSFNPGGFLSAPTSSSSLMLYPQIEPLHSIYVSSEKIGSFIVHASLSYYRGSAYTEPKTLLPEILHVKVSIPESNHVLVSNFVTVNSTRNVFDFDLSPLVPQMEGYNVTLSLTSVEGNKEYTAMTQLFYLPDKTSGSVTKINNLYGGMLFKNAKTNNEFIPLLPFGFYADYSGWLNVSTDNIQAYYDMGLNAIHPVAEYDGSASWDYMDEINLLWQYDMRYTFMNSTSVVEQVTAVKDHPALFAWYTGDEPDGWEYALNATQIAYDTIASIDKYHPVGLVLNCQNYYFEYYSNGADFLMEDAYPVGINASYSKWGTPCNSTYGDCGCDNCQGSLRDIPDRLDDFTTYQEWLGQLPRPLWAVQQAFDGEGYWARDPTVKEVWVMNQLAFNHKAKAIMSWIYPTTAEIAAAYSAQAKVVTVKPVVDFMLGAHLEAITVPGYESLDVASWTVQGQTMISIVSTSNININDTVKIPLAGFALKIDSQPWGNLTLELNWSHQELEIKGLAALTTSLVILEL
ncbi:MAG: hypothetical protein M1818_000394 [Claussenomyces sp. TS43310]|nr:MAG: hypothetical protein M1818_000394 [Claussenomyces sp. TS43310]